jgi:hypothetical protein
VHGCVYHSGMRGMGCIHSQKACVSVCARAVGYNGFEHKSNELDRGCGLSLSACIMLHAR